MYITIKGWRIFFITKLILTGRSNSCTVINIHSNSHRNSQQDARVYEKVLLFHVYIKLNMLQATHRPSSGAQNCTSSLWFCISERLLDVVVAGRWRRPATTTSNNLCTYANQRLLVQFELLMMGGVSPETCWALYKHGIIKSFGTLLHQVGYFYVNYNMTHGSMHIMFNLLKLTGCVMHHQFNIQQLYALSTLYLCFLHLSENKQRLVRLTA